MNARTPSIILIGCSVGIAACSLSVLLDALAHDVTTAVYAWIAMSVFWLPIAYLLLHKRPLLNKATIVTLGALAFVSLACVSGRTAVLSGDVYRYQWDGAVQNAGIDPYAYPPNHADVAHLHTSLAPTRDSSLARLTFNHLRTIYPPAAEYFFAASSALARDGTAWKFPTIAMILASCWALVLLLRGMGRRAEGAFVFLLSPVVLLHGAMDAHIDVVMTAFALWSFVAWRKQWWLAAGILLGIAVGVKILPLLFVPWMLRHTTMRNRMYFVLGMLTTLLVIYAPFLNARVVESLADFSVRFAANSLLGTVLVQMLPVAAARIGLLVLFGCSLAWLWFGRLRMRTAFEQLAVAFLLLLLFSPIVHPWYLITLVALGILAPLRPITMFGATIALSGITILVYSKGGVWFEHPALLALEYVPVLLLLAYDAVGRRVHAVAD